MILSRETIKEKLEEGSIVVEPEPREDQFQPASLDLRIGGELYLINQRRYIEHDDVVRLPPKQPCLGYTIDDVGLPNDILAQVAGRSTVARRGVIVHMTAGVVDPGWRGQLTLEMYNFTDKSQEFEVGERVGQLVFKQLDKETSGYDGSYQGQEGVTLAKTSSKEDEKEKPEV